MNIVEYKQKPVIKNIIEAVEWLGIIDNDFETWLSNNLMWYIENNCLILDYGYYKLKVEKNNMLIKHPFNNTFEVLTKEQFNKQYIENRDIF